MRSAWRPGSRKPLTGGAKLVAGGERKGSVITPAILTGTTPGMKVRDEEVFGPVVAIEPYDDFEEALAAGESLEVRIAGRAADARLRAASLPPIASLKWAR